MSNSNLMMGEVFPNLPLILYQTEDGRTRVQCRFEEEADRIMSRSAGEWHRPQAEGWSDQ